MSVELTRRHVEAVLTRDFTSKDITAIKLIEFGLRLLDLKVLMRGTHQVGRWQETGDVAFERDFAVRLRWEDDRIRRIAVMPTGQSAMPAAG